MNKIEKHTMTVLVNGTTEVREVSHCEQDPPSHIGRANFNKPPRQVPVLKEGEQVLHMLGGGPPHIVRVNWPEPSRSNPRNFQHLYGQTFNEAQDDE
jgi:hypothetical protein